VDTGSRQGNARKQNSQGHLEKHRFRVACKSVSSLESDLQADGNPQKPNERQHALRGFPADRLDAGNPLQLAIEPLTDGLGAKPLGVNVGRRGN
jgi:hypothetical protein